MKSYEMYDKWNIQKKKLDLKKNTKTIKERDVFFLSLGKNVGSEQSGKGDNFVRPVLIYKKFNNSVFLGIPLSTTQNRGKYYFEFKFQQNKSSVAILSQIKLFDSKRLDRKIGKISLENFIQLKKQLIGVLDD